MARLIGIGDNVVDCNYTTRIVYPGGNCVNFAIFGKQLGHETAYVGKIAEDRWGNIILRALRDNGVDCSRCVKEKGETGKCGIHLTDGDRVIVEENDAGIVKERPLVITDELISYIKTFDIAHSSCYSHIEGELHKIRKAGVPVLYDFSDEWDEEILKQICPSIDIAFLSGGDLSETLLRDCLRKCVEEYGCRMAISTMGERGAIVYNGRKYYKKMPCNFHEAVIDTTGAGDSWITAFISSYIDGMKSMEKMKQGNPEHFVKKGDCEDYEDQLIEYGMCLGNMLARRNCLVEGSFGNGVSFGDAGM